MPFTSTGPSRADSAYYLEYLTEVLTKLNAFFDPSEFENDVWHYTTGSGLLGMLEKGEIFATQVACLNDSTEIRYASRLLREALQRSPRPDNAGPRLAAFLQDYIQDLADTSDEPSHRTSFYFVSCFTTLKDDLSQWRSYSGGENGIALRFTVKDLMGRPSSGVLKVNYDSEDHLRLAAEAASKTIDYYLGGLDAGYLDWDNVFRQAWVHTLSHAAPVVKDPGFSAENEVRVIYPARIPADYPNMVVRQKKSMMSMHIPLKYPYERSEDDLRLPIKEVMIGPGRHKAVTAISVDTLLQSKGYGSNLVTLSKRPYQET